MVYDQVIDAADNRKYSKCGQEAQNARRDVRKLHIAGSGDSLSDLNRKSQYNYDREHINPRNDHCMACVGQPLKDRINTKNKKNLQNTRSIIRITRKS